MKETVCVDLSDDFRGQFKIYGSEPSLLPFVHSGLLARDMILKNSDRIVELCEAMSKTMEVGLTERAAEHVRKVRDDSPVSSPSLRLPFDLKRFQRRCMHALDGVEGSMLVCSCGTGKAQPLYSKVLTESGFKAMGDIRIGDKVVTRRGTLAPVTGVFSQGKKRVYRVHLADGRHADCCIDHLWTTVQRRSGADVFVTKSLGDMIDAGLKYKCGSYKFKVPLIVPRASLDADLPIDSYVLGVLIGDGALGGSSLYVSSVEDDIVEGIAARLGPEYSVAKTKSANCSWSIKYLPDYHGNPALSSIRALGLDVKSTEKFIPGIYMGASAQQRLDLLRGLFDTDGHVGKNGSLVYFTSSEQLRDDVVSLCRGLGMTARFSVDHSAGCNPNFCIYIGSHIRPFSSKKHTARFDGHVRNSNRSRIRQYTSISIVGIEDLGFDAEMQCLMVDDPEHLYITDDYIVTHNTAMGTALAVREFDRGNVDKIVVFCPAPLVKQWVPWLEKATTLTVGTVNRNAKPPKRQAWYNTDRSDIWVINYDRTNTKDWQFMERALRGKRLFFVYDEVQRLKSRARPRHQKFKALEKSLDIRFKCGLTATPLERSPEDYYNEWRILDASIYGTVKDFERCFTYNNGERDMWRRYLGFQNLDFMGLLSAPQVFVAEKTNPEIAAEFPKRQEIVIDLELSPPERALYDEIAEYGSEVSEFDRLNGTESKQRALFMLMLQRVCRMPEVLLEEGIYEYSGENPFYFEQLRRIREIVMRHADDLAGSKNSEKLKATEELVEQIVGGGEKMIVFAQHTHNCLIPLSEHLSGYRPLMYMGGQTDAQRGVIERSFREGENYNLMLMSDAGREGIDLPEGRYLLHYDTPPLHSRYQQRSDRIHRISSKHDCVTIYRFVTRGTIEERIEETMAGRKALAQEMGIGEYEAAGENDMMNDMAYILGF